MAQNASITGRVTIANAKTPLANASVFLSNSSFGTITAEDGTFTLNGLKPGQYSLVVTTVGYEDHTQTVLIANDPVKLTIELSPKNVQLKEVSISSLSKADWKIAFARFKKEFIGEDDNAGDCKLLNPDILNFSFHQNKNVLEANSDGFLIVENHALGYRVKFLLKDYKSDNFTGSVFYSGQRFFEELPGKDPQKKKWNAKRDEAYYGSAMQFYRSLYKDSLADAGFKIYHLTRVLNPDRPAEAVIQQNLIKYDRLNDDNYLHWNNMEALPVYSVQILDKEEADVSNMVLKTDQPGLFAITFPDYLYVIYTKKWEETFFRNMYRTPDMLNYQTTIISFMNDDRIALFDRNGTIIGESPAYEGTWSKARLSAMLPVDYEPVNQPVLNQ